MSRCVEFYQKVEREGSDWCEKCPDAVRKIENYLDLCRELESKGIPKSQTIVSLTEGAARPLFKIRDETARQKAISDVETALKRTTPSGGQYTPKLTVKVVEKIANAAIMAPHREEM